MFKLTVLPALLLAFGLAAFGQTTQSTSATETAPAAKSPVKRRGLDQFGLSSGVLSSSESSTLSGDDGSTLTTEAVNEKLRAELSFLGQHLFNLESAYRDAYAKRKDPRYRAIVPEQLVFDHLVKSTSSSTNLRAGVFEGRPFKDPRNAALFEDLRVTLDDLVLVTSRMQRDFWSNVGTEAPRLVQKYNVRTFQNENGMSMFQTGNLVMAIFARARADAARLERQTTTR